MNPSASAAQAARKGTVLSPAGRGASIHTPTGDTKVTAVGTRGNREREGRDKKEERVD